MGAREHWIEITPQGAFLIGENDGWVALRKGAERSRTPVIVTGIDSPRTGSPWGYVNYTCPYHSGSLAVAVAECERIRAELEALPRRVLSDQAAGVEAERAKMRAPTHYDEEVSDE